MYDHQKIEKKWQAYWEKKSLFQAEIDHSKEKYYILDMFPYPSGSGLHVGHVTGYTATDILARYKRHQGFNVLHPMGWDSFGLPAEQYAIKTGTHPRDTTKVNIATYKRQLKSLGFSYDWSKEIATSDPSYYKWTQWIFTKLFEKGLAYEAHMLVNYCPHLGTVLANEEVENGVSKEGKHPVERRPLKQWMLKITEYAEVLLKDLDGLDWPEYLKTLQRNWIGKSVGSRVDFQSELENVKISCYTTCCHTLYGVTFVAISPEHPQLESFITSEQEEKVNEYKKEAAKKTDLERTDLAKTQSGVFTGSYVIHPLTKKRIAVWVGDYVLMSYGYGAVMGVPSHDERDFALATKYGIEKKAALLPLIEDLDDDTTQEGYESLCQDIISGNAVWAGNGRSICEEDSKLFGLGIEPAKEYVISQLEAFKSGGKETQYKLRDWLFSRQRYWGEPFPILHLEDGGHECLLLQDLPLMPPEMEDFKPTGDGKGPLSKVKSWIETVHTSSGKKAWRETNTMPQWAGSCWYYLRYLDPNNDSEIFSTEKEKYWMPVDMYVGGVEHAVLHLLYARFWHKVLYDIGVVSTKEPFASLRNQGLVTSLSFKKQTGEYILPNNTKLIEGEYFEKSTNERLNVQIEKMSKSKLNGVTPDDIIVEFGADALRLYEMFMAPFDKEKIWNSKAVKGCRRFLQRIYMLHKGTLTDKTSDKIIRLTHRLIAGVTEDIESMHYNTAIAKMMEFLNEFEREKTFSTWVLEVLSKLLSPFAPHIAEECWSMLGNSTSIAFEPFPLFEEEFLVSEEVTYAIQVNGKMRGTASFPTSTPKDAVLEKVRNLDTIKKYINNTVVKEIFVPSKLVNIVVKK